MALNYYEILGVNPHCDFALLKKAYFSKAKKCHPDLFNNSRVKEEEFKLLVMAFDNLSDPLKRAKFDASIELKKSQQSTVAKDINVSSDFSIMDTPADDILEELIVGNSPPPDARLATLFLDLERTDVFMAFREGKNLFYSKHYAAAQFHLLKAVRLSPGNILNHYYLARTYAFLGKFAKSKTHYRSAIKLGARRVPPQNLSRIKDEYETVQKKHLPTWYAITSFFRGQRSRSSLPEDERMIDSTNKEIAKIMSSEKKNRKLLK